MAALVNPLATSFPHFLGLYRGRHVRNAVDAACRRSLPSLGEVGVQRPLESWPVRPHLVIGDLSGRVDQINRIGHAAVLAVDRGAEVVDKHGPSNRFQLLIVAGICQFLLIICIRRPVLTRVGLSQEDIQKLHSFAVLSMEFFELRYRTPS